MNRCARRAALWAAAALWLAGCSNMRSLSRDLAWLRDRGVLQVRVEQDGQPAVGAAILFFDADRGTIAHVTLVPGSGRVSVELHSGRYLVAAFRDRNGNLFPDPHELRTFRGTSAAIEVERDQLVAIRPLELATSEHLGAAQADALRRAHGHRPYPRAVTPTRLGDRRFDYEAGRVGMWAPASFLASGLDGLYLLEAFDATKPAVVFVHGIGGTPRSFAPLVQAARERGAQAWAYFYPTALPLAQVARDFRNELELTLATHRPRAIVIVAHSMGGLVVARYARGRGCARLVREVLTIATPFGGVGIARLGRDFSPVVMPCWRDLCPGSDFLRSLHRPWRKHVRHTLVRAFQVRGDTQRGDGTVPLWSQLDAHAFSHADEVVPVQAKHVASLAEPVTIEALGRAIERVVSPAPSVPAQPPPDPRGSHTFPTPLGTKSRSSMR